MFQLALLFFLFLKLLTALLIQVLAPAPHFELLALAVEALVEAVHRFELVLLFEAEEELGEGPHLLLSLLLITSITIATFATLPIPLPTASALPLTHLLLATTPFILALGVRWRARRILRFRPLTCFLGPFLGIGGGGLLRIGWWRGGGFASLILQNLHECLIGDSLHPIEMRGEYHIPERAVLDAHADYLEGVVHELDLGVLGLLGDSLEYQSDDAWGDNFLQNQRLMLRLAYKLRSLVHCHDLLSYHTNKGEALRDDLVIVGAQQALNYGKDFAFGDFVREF